MWQWEHYNEYTPYSEDYLILYLPKNRKIKLIWYKPFLKVKQLVLWLKVEIVHYGVTRQWKGIFYVSSSSREQRLSSIKVQLPSKVIFHQWSSSIKGCLPSKVVFYQRLSSIEGCLSSKVKIHPWRMCIRRKLIIWKTSQSSLTPWTNSIKQ